MIIVSQNHDVYEIKFPFDWEIIQLIKNVPGRNWNPDKKIWSIPVDRLGFLMNQLRGTKFESQVQVYSNEDINKNASLNEKVNIPQVDISEYTYRIQDGLKPYKHQLDSLKYAKWRYEHGLTSGFLLADEPGGAKTAQVMNIALYMKQFHQSKHCLVIACVNSAKYNWKEDILKHTNGEINPYILGTRLRRDKTENLNNGGKEKYQDLITMKMYGKEDGDPLPYFLIMNIEAVRTKEKKNYIVADRLIELINSNEIDIIALDEVHRNCSMSSMQGKQLLRIKKATEGHAQWIPMTGTPITSKPTDVFLPLRLIDGHTSNSYWSWCQNYCIYGGFGGKEIIGYKNIPQLQKMLQPNMLRRLKKDILDLPPKIRFTEYIENTPYQKDLYRKVKEDLITQRDNILRALNPMTSFLRLRQVNGSPELVDLDLQVNKSYLSKNAKLQRLIELVDDIIAQDEKVVIFSNWVEPLQTVYRFLKQKYQVCCYTGTMSQEVRQKHKEAFIANPDCHILLGTVGALGTSHTLTVARNIIFYDSPWNPADVEQCEDRCHRPGTSQSVNIYTLITKDTIDETVHQIISRKEGTANYIVDNKLDLRNHPELIDLLLREG